MDSTFCIYLNHSDISTAYYRTSNVKNKKSTLCIPQKVPVIIIINSNYRYAFVALITGCMSKIMEVDN